MRYKDKELKTVISRFTKGSPHLLNSMEKIDELYPEGIVIDFKNEEYETYFIIQSGESVITSYVNIYDNKLIISSNEWDYYIQYRLSPECTLIGKIYESESRKITYQKSRSEKMYTFIYQDENNSYNINITRFNGMFDYLELIYALLDQKNDIKRIKDLLDIVLKNVKPECVEINIRSTDTPKMSNVIVCNGELTKYVEYLTEDDVEEKIFWKEGKFYIEKTKCYDLDEDEIPYVKKIGGYNGKTGE